MTEEEKKAIDLLKFYEGFFKNIGHEEEVKSIESVINYIEKLKKEIEEKTIIIMAGAEKVKQLEKENEELKNKVVKRDKELIKLEEYANKNFERKDDVKAKYIPKDKIREKLEKIEKEKKQYYDAGQPLIYMLLKNQLKSLIEEKQ